LSDGKSQPFFFVAYANTENPSVPPFSVGKTFFLPFLSPYLKKMTEGILSLSSMVKMGLHELPPNSHPEYLGRSSSFSPFFFFSLHTRKKKLGQKAPPG